ncbi:hypothetical protein TNCV_1091071 [Trichonephila clavipes]|uniref:Uncharacterized protein n=1 Tax=Trichonephila clavipes TaxID=2585209 RepID=A0A8X6VQI2_TRICX|nr:hypothetical protein TNCV_1091071 [Trichonephila clavipes]
MVCETSGHATYNWPCEKQGFSKSKPKIVIVWPCALLMAIANAKKIGNCKHFEWVGGHQTCLSINRLWHELCDMLRRLVGTLLDIMIVQFRNEKVSNHGSIPITIDCNVVAFIVFEEGFHQPIKRTKQSVFLDVTVFRHTLVD